MRDRLLKSAAVALTVAAITVPLAHATSPDDGYKSGYPQLHAIHTYKANTSPAANTDEGYKSGYPQLHAIHTFNAQTPPIQNDQPQLPLERRGHRRWNSSRSNLPRSRRRPRPQPPPHQDRRLRQVNQSRGEQVREHLISPSAA